VTHRQKRSARVELITIGFDLIDFAADGFILFQNRYRKTFFCEANSGCESAESGADYDYVHIYQAIVDLIGLTEYIFTVKKS
jgi:hypothetical protein